MSELSGEKIDIIDHDEDPPVSWPTRCRRPRSSRSPSSTPTPARPGSWFPTSSLSGDRQGGQNARLAARLTGWRIDIRSDAAPPGDDAHPGAGHGAGHERQLPGKGGSEQRGDDGRLFRDPARDSVPETERAHRRAEGPVRTCMGCRKRELAVELLRVVAVSVGNGSPAVTVDQAGNLPGGVRGCIPTIGASRQRFGGELCASVAHHRFTGHLRGGRALREIESARRPRSREQVAKNMSTP